jgi:ESAT-6 family protein
MTINYQFGDADAHGATTRAQAATPEAEQQAIRDVLATGNFGVIYEQENTHGQKVQTAGSNMASTDSAVGSGWA